VTNTELNQVTNNMNQIVTQLKEEVLKNLFMKKKEATNMKNMMKAEKEINMVKEHSINKEDHMMKIEIKIIRELDISTKDKNKTDRDPDPYQDIVKKEKDRNQIERLEKD